MLAILLVSCGTRTGAPATGLTGGPGASHSSAIATFEPLAHPVEVKFRTSFFPTLLYGPAYVAQDRFWTPLGIKGRVLAGTGSSAAIQTVGAGAEQMGMAEFVAVANAIKEGVPITILAVVQQRDVNGIIYRDANPIRHWRDLEGKTIGVFPYGAGQRTLKFVAQSQGVNLDRVRIVTVNPGQELVLLRSGKLDGVFGYARAQDVWLTCSGTPASSLAVWDAGFEALSTTIIANNEWIKRVGDDVVARAMLGLVEGATLMKADPERSYEILRKLEPNAQTDRAQELAGLHADGYVHWSFEGERGLKQHGWGWINPERVERSKQAWISVGLLQGDVDLSRSYTNKYLEHPAVHPAALAWEEASWGQLPSDVKRKCHLD